LRRRPFNFRAGAAFRCSHRHRLFRPLHRTRRANAGAGRLRYTFAEEGELVSYHERSLADLGLDDVRGKVAFFQGDACNLKPNFTGYDLILAANLIDRLYSPAKFLDSVHERLNPGGLLLIATPCTWLEEHTPRAEWVGGFKQDGENFTTLDGLKAAWANISN
jgi:putative 4-mercaptohistidine N1-methyltranferase